MFTEIIHKDKYTINDGTKINDRGDCKLSCWITALNAHLADYFNIQRAIEHRFPSTLLV